MQAGKDLVRSVHFSLTHRSGAGWFLTAEGDDVVHLVVVVVDSYVQSIIVPAKLKKLRRPNMMMSCSVLF